MDFDNFRAMANAEIANFCLRKSDEISLQYGNDVRDIFNSYLSVLRRGGKRNRAAMAMYAYEIFGGTKQEILRKIGLVQELLQTYLLVLDDIMDRSDMRRNGATAHKLLESDFRKNRGFGDAEHYGISEAICAGMLGQNMAFEEILELDSLWKTETLSLANQMMIHTAFGQILDIHGEAFHEDDEKKILQMLREKTAFYSFFLPLEMGRILAGNQDERISQTLDHFAKNAGVSFQLRDDIDGLFEDLGKPNKSDISEGKRTILAVYALKHADEVSRKFIEQCLGESDLSDQNFAKILDIFQKSGAKTYTEKMANGFAEHAKQNLDELNKLYDFADQLAPLYHLVK